MSGATSYLLSILEEDLLSQTEVGTREAATGLGGTGSLGIAIEHSAVVAATAGNCGMAVGGERLESLFCPAPLVGPSSNNNTKRKHRHVDAGQNIINKKKGNRKKHSSSSCVGKRRTVSGPGPDTLWGIVKNGSKIDESSKSTEEQQLLNNSAFSFSCSSDGKGGTTRTYNNKNTGLSAPTSLLDMFFNGASPTNSLAIKPAIDGTPLSNGGPKVCINTQGELIIDEVIEDEEESFKTGGGTDRSLEGGVAYEVQQEAVQMFADAYARTKGIVWTEELTAKFYGAIEAYGSDLMMVKALFPDLTERQVRDKFKAERRRNPKKLSAVLNARVALSRKSYEQVNGRIVDIDVWRRGKLDAVRAKEFLLDDEDGDHIVFEEQEAEAIV